MRQDPFTVLRPRDAYPGAYSVDDREYRCRPSTPTVSPVRVPRLHLPRPLISITSDNEISSVIYRDESDDESDDRIVEEDEGNAGNRVSNSEYATFTSFERTAPPREYKRSLLAPPMTFDGNFYDTIPYIDQNDDGGPAEASELCVQPKSRRNGYERCEAAACDDSSKLQDHDQRTLDIADSALELHVPAGNCNSSAAETRSLNGSALSAVRVIGSNALTASRMDDFEGNASNGTECTLRVDEKSVDDVTNSEDCADESSSTTINDGCASGRLDGDVEEEGISTPKMYTIMPELHLDLTGLNSDVSSDESKTEKCWKSPEDVRLGCGRVAALAKHFSKLGDAGLIRFKSTKLSDSRQFVSEPDITTPEESDEHLHGPCGARKEYKSDSDLTRGENSRADPVGRRNVVLFDVETDGSLAIQECRFHCCGAKRVTVARIPSLNDILGTKKVGNYNLDTPPIELSSQSRDLIKAEGCRGDSDSGSNINKLSPEQQQMIVEQLEHFSNLDNIDAPLFIPDRGMERASLRAPRTENDALASVDSISSQPHLADRKETARLGKSFPSLIDADDSFQRTRRDKIIRSSSLSSVRSPPPSRSSTGLSPSNIAESAPSLFSEDSETRSCEKRPKSCLFIDLSHSSAKSRSNKDSSERSFNLPSRASAYSRPRDDKLNIVRVRIAGPLCSSEADLISAAVGGGKIDSSMDRRDGFVKLTRSCDSILDSKLLDSCDHQSRSSESLHKGVDSLCGPRDRSGLPARQKARWKARHRSLEELESKRGSKKQGDSTDFTSARPAKFQTRLNKSLDGHLNSEDGEEARWARHGSFEELKSGRESRQRDDRSNWTSSGRVQAEARRFECTPKKRFRAKRMSHDRLLKGSALELSCRVKDEERHEWSIEQKSHSELDISRRKSGSERDGWSFRDISPLKDDDRTMALRKLPLSCVMLLNVYV